MKSISRGARSAFTLLEMMIVIAILGLVATIAAVRADIFSSAFKLRKASAELAGRLQLAHDRAALDRRRFAVAYDMEKNRVALLDSADFDIGVESGRMDAHFAERFAGWINLPGGIEITRVVFGRNESVYSGSFMAVFLSTGVVARHVVEIADANGALQYLSVNPFTAEVTIGEGKYYPKD